jgi:hypothetical protein
MNLRHCLFTLCVFSFPCLSPGFAQNYRCDWSVVGIGGGEMSGTSYKCGSTVGQTAAGQLTGSSYWALIGFWQPEAQTGVREAQWSSGQVVRTRLYTPMPNPFRSRVVIRYSLATDVPAALEVYDRVGRLVRNWAVSRKPSAVSAVSWSGTDDRGRSLANGIYFVRLAAGD